jgi:hypothetical protein
LDILIRELATDHTPASKHLSVWEEDTVATKTLT